MSYKSPILSNVPIDKSSRELSFFPFGDDLSVDPWNWFVFWRIWTIARLLPSVQTMPSEDWESRLAELASRQFDNSELSCRCLWPWVARGQKPTTAGRLHPQLFHRTPCADVKLSWVSACGVLNVALGIAPKQRLQCSHAKQLHMHCLWQQDQ